MRSEASEASVRSPSTVCPRMHSVSSASSGHLIASLTSVPGTPISTSGHPSPSRCSSPTISRRRLCNLTDSYRIKIQAEPTFLSPLEPYLNMTTYPLVRSLHISFGRCSPTSNTSSRPPIDQLPGGTWTYSSLSLQHPVPRLNQFRRHHKIAETHTDTLPAHLARLRPQRCIPRRLKYLEAGPSSSVRPRPSDG